MLRQFSRFGGGDCATGLSSIDCNFERNRRRASGGVEIPPLELLKNTDVVSNDDAAESVYAALEASMCTDWEVKTDSFVFPFADPSR